MSNLVKTIADYEVRSNSSVADRLAFSVWKGRVLVAFCEEGWVAEHLAWTLAFQDALREEGNKCFSQLFLEYFEGMQKTATLRAA